MEDFYKNYLFEKYGETVYNRNAHWLEMTLEEVEERYDNFLCDYYEAFTDCDFLYDIYLYKKMKEKEK